MLKITLLVDAVRRESCLRDADAFDSLLRYIYFRIENHIPSIDSAHRAVIHEIYCIHVKDDDVRKAS